ncbi:MAG: SIR2 family protein [Pseudomonadota bacterium]
MRVKDLIGHLKSADNITIIIGAGASRSADIPLASELVRQINENDDVNHCLSGLNEEERKDYGRVMRALAPNERKKIIQPILDDSKINWGHIALACLIRDTNVSRVLTFNFDLVLERATSLLGMHLPVYDFGVAPTIDISGLAAPAIYHLHGQSYGLRLMNSDKETEKHKEALRPLLSDSVRNHLTLVIGYSGEADPAFKIITEEYSSNTRLFWLGHGEDPRPHLKPLLEKNYAEYIGKCDFDQTMIQLARGLNCWPPSVLDNPPLHVLEELKDVVDFPGEDSEGHDILSATRERLQDAAETWDAERTSLGRVETAVLKGETPEPTVENEVISDKERDLRAWAVIRQGVALAEEAKILSASESAEKFTEAGQKYATALNIKSDKHEAYFNWGIALADEAKMLSGSERLEKLRESGEKFSAALDIKSNMYEAFHNWANVLGDEAELLNGSERFDKFREAESKYAASLDIKPDDYTVLSSWGSTILDHANFLSGAERTAKLEEAEEKVGRARDLKGHAIYNFACLLACRGKISEALDELEACLKAGTLPSAEHLREDTDMDPLRDEPRFKALLKKAT